MEAAAKDTKHRQKRRGMVKKKTCAPVKRRSKHVSSFPQEGDIIYREGEEGREREEGEEVGHISDKKEARG